MPTIIYPVRFPEANDFFIYFPAGWDDLVPGELCCEMPDFKNASDSDETYQQ